jgi:hypothetical protein
MDILKKWVKDLSLNQFHCDTDSRALQVNVTALASK